MTVGADINVPLKMNCNNIGDPLTYHLAPSSDQTYKPNVQCSGL